MFELEDLFKILKGQDKESDLYKNIRHNIIQTESEIYENELNLKIKLEVQNLVLERVLKENGISVSK